MRAEPKDAGKVAIVTLGGAGHEPALSGFVGEGMLDASVVGDVFAAPGAPKVLEALRLLKREAGIVLVTLNHAGDRMSASKALRDAQKEGIKVCEIVTHEDISAGIDVDPECEIVITAGAVEALSTVFMSILNEGDEVIVPTPYFPVYDDVIKMSGGRLVGVPSKIENGFKPMPEDIERAITPKTRAIMINSPNNPTGATSSRAELEAIAEIAKKRDLLVVSDECYEKFAYDESAPHVSLVSFPGMKERTFTISAASKTFSMTGWRVGWLVFPAETRPYIMKSHQGFATCANSFAQMGVVEALRNAWPDVAVMIGEYKRRRDLMVEMLSGIDGVDIPTPSGAFYAFPSIKGLGVPSFEFCSKLLEETGVSTVPGQPFVAPDGYMRLTYCRPAEEIKEALTRIGEFAAKIKR
jgi:aspartate aminotransferase/aminotransferase